MLFLFCVDILWLTLEEQPTQGWAFFSELFGGDAAPELRLWVRVGVNQERRFTSIFMSLSPGMERAGEGRPGLFPCLG